ncbi:RloB-like protein [Lactobacillus apis]|uniref:RloB family protein n=1 Tax=Lactobacillus apis TaxID=303541 RepID=UPI0008160F8F|nr:RloB family protein [Lactobacillus apis]GGG35046.1 hypothetical protein GCM10007323_06420 [Lactobacillus apis]SCB84066.1 RloB-like protein [Lactobacillus apis]
MSRSRKKRPVKEKILFFVEGTTEKNYFDELFFIYNLRTAKATKIMKGSGDWVDKTASFIKNTPDNRYKSDSETKIYIIFDKDGYDDKRIAKMREKATSLKGIKKASCQVCVSNCSFEVWLLAHYEKMTPKVIESSSIWQKNLKRKLTEHLGEEYVKVESTNTKLIRKILEDDKVYDAINNTQSIAVYSDTNQSTDITSIIKNLIKQQ